MCPDVDRQKSVESAYNAPVSGNAVSGAIDGTSSGSGKKSPPGKKKTTAKSGRLRAHMLRRCIQAVSLAIFLALLLLTISPLPQSAVPVDLFLRLDPSVAVFVPLAAREWIASLWPGLVVLLLALAGGRLFCGYICPMGTTLDIGNGIGGFIADGRKRKERPGPVLDGKGVRIGPDSPALPKGVRHGKYLLAVFLAAAAVFGLNLCFWASPIPLITRFYALLAHPFVTLAGNEAQMLLHPLAASADIPALSYLQIHLRRYDSMYFILFFFTGLFVLERIRPRFWCRYLCPSGALLALFSLRPFWRRRVHICTSCGKCSRECPTGAIYPEGNATAHAECVVCRSCTDVCPVRGVAFAFGPDVGGRDVGGTEEQRGEEKTRDGENRKGVKEGTSAAGQTFKDGGMAKNGPEIVSGRGSVVGGGKSAKSTERGFLPTRRAFIAAAGTGVCFAAMGHTNLHSLLREGARGDIWSEACVRPPGALPEKSFLSHCIRCGQCMKVCPTNGLQPVWFAAGVEGMFSPALVARRGPCDPDCNACGRVCPTGAISSLPVEQKHWAKIGTAVVVQGYCLAWAENRSCVVCEEVCPYGAIKCEQRGGSVAPVPVVRAERCFGCGYCEQHCPVRVPAIVVRPLNALRLEGTEYETEARRIGLNLVPGSKDMPVEYYPEELPSDGLPPGFSE